jgi:hypothetical protein
VRVQAIDHDPWGARFVAVEEARFAFLDRFQREHGVALVYDDTLAMHDIKQVWRAARLQRSAHRGRAAPRPTSTDR